MHLNRIISLTAVSVFTLALLGSTPLYAGKGGVKGPGKGGGETPPPPVEYNITSGEVSGEAYSLGVDATLLGGAATVQVGPVPRAKLCPDGGYDEATLASINLLDLASSATMYNMTTGDVGGFGGGATSISTIEALSLLRGLIRADVLSTYCSSYTDGYTAGSSAGSIIAGLSVAGIAIDIDSEANSEIAVLDLTLEKGLLGIGNKVRITVSDKDGNVILNVSELVNNLTEPLLELLSSLLDDLVSGLLGGTVKVATITFNEQTLSGNGETSTAMDNSAIHVHLDTNVLALLNLGGSDLQIASGDIYVSATHCDVSVNTDDVPPVIPGEESGFVTGGGTIGHNDTGNFASFGFNARPNKGHLNVIDHEAGVHIQGYTVSDFSVSDDGKCATFSGMAKYNGAKGHTYEATVCDYGEPGTSDTFSVSSNGYSNGGTLTGGNIQMH